MFWMGQSMSAAMSTVGFSEPLLANVGKQSGNFLNVLPEGQVRSSRVFYPNQWCGILTTIAVVELCIRCHSSFDLYNGSTSRAKGEFLNNGTRLMDQIN